MTKKLILIALIFSNATHCYSNYRAQAEEIVAQRKEAELRAIERELREKDIEAIAFLLVYASVGIMYIAETVSDKVASGYRKARNILKNPESRDKAICYCALTGLTLATAGITLKALKQPVTI